MNPIEVAVATDRPSYAPGSAVTVTLTVRNRGEAVTTLPFASGQRYDFEVRDATGAIVWHWGEGMGFIQMLGEESLRPGDSLRYDARARAPAAPGRYTLAGVLTARDRARRATTTFLVE
ncbi:MAG: BsuPI-related putative proteinase inhibitor [Gemmatimonadota bacterium]|nr:BsuPI-related putative proteinase inhibitor [Gemmatimonadota bacterium]